MLGRGGGGGQWADRGSPICSGLIRRWEENWRQKHTSRHPHSPFSLSVCLALPRSLIHILLLCWTPSNTDTSLPPLSVFPSLRLLPGGILKVLLSLITTIYNTQQLVNGFTFYHPSVGWGHIFLLCVASVEIEP